MISHNKVQKLIKKSLAIVVATLFLFKSTVIECNEELFSKRCHEKSTFPKQGIHIMSTLAEI